VLNDPLHDFLSGHLIIRIEEFKTSPLLGLTIRIFVGDAVWLNGSTSMAHNINLEVLHQISGNHVRRTNHHLRHVLQDEYEIFFK
jgi:hypothetical protein